jgi:hypothetical protein
MEPTQFKHEISQERISYENIVEEQNSESQPNEQLQGDNENVQETREPIPHNLRRLPGRYATREF